MLTKLLTKSAPVIRYRHLLSAHNLPHDFLLEAQPRRLTLSLRFPPGIDLFLPDYRIYFRATPLRRTNVIAVPQSKCSHPTPEGGSFIRIQSTFLFPVPAHQILVHCKSGQLRSYIHHNLLSTDQPFFRITTHSSNSFKYASNCVKPPLGY